MAKRTATARTAAIGALSIALPLLAALPAQAQQTTAATDGNKPEAAATQAPVTQASPDTPATAAAVTPAPGEAAAPIAPTPAPAPAPAVVPAAAPPTTAPAPAPVQAQALEPTASPLLLAIRARLTDPALVRASDKEDLTALTAAHAAATAKPLWVTEAGLTERAKSAIDEIRRAEDYGLVASAFDLPDTPASSPDALAAAEVRLSLAVLKYVNHARGGRIPDPSRISRYLDRKPPIKDPAVILAEVATAADAAAYLRAQHPRHPEFEKLRQALLKARAPSSVPEAAPAAAPARVTIPAGATIKPGAKHQTIALLRQRLAVPATPGQEEVYDAALQQAVQAVQAEAGLPANGHITKETRRALNGPEKAAPTPTRPRSPADIQRILVNMERWRWMPEDMGAFHVWNNIPEFQTRVVSNGEIVHQEKIIVGKTDTQTPIFSADMQFVIFHPSWGVPESIKVKEILPHLKRSSSGFLGFGGGSDTRVLERHNLKVSLNGRPVDASKVDWSTANIRAYSFTQPPGGQNVLGIVKFRFPNKHDVYMHDTPQRNLFAQSVRTMSHGCMRVHNPRRLAEVILHHDKGWGPEKISALIAGSQSEIKLEKTVPVHVTYLTALADGDGKVHFFPDVYGHDARLGPVLNGQPVPTVAHGSGTDEPKPAAREARKPRKKGKEEGYDFTAAFSGLFGN